MIRFLEHSKFKFENRINKTTKDTVFYYGNIAIAYSNFAENSDSVFYYIDKFLSLDRHLGCSMLVAHENIMKESKKGIYWGKLNKPKYLYRLVACKNAIREWDKISDMELQNDTTLDHKMISLIDKMIDDDQRFRIASEFEKQLPIDQKNRILLDSIFTNYGFPGKSQVSRIYVTYISVVFLHTDIEFQEKWLPLMIESYKKQEVGSVDIKYALDKFHTIKYSKQFFGTQRKYDSKTKKTSYVEKYSLDKQKEILGNLDLLELLKGQR